jgi:acetyl esterase/lipase
MHTEDVARLMDSEIAAFLARFPVQFGSLNADSIDASRALMTTVFPYESSGHVRIEEHIVPAENGEPEVVLRVHRPVNAEGPLPCLYWMHGGGLVMGWAKGDDARFESWCQTHQMVAVSVEYRLAPETPYPGPLEDCYRGLRFIQQHAVDLGIDPAQIGIGGSSAGGGLAAGLALLARDRGEIEIQFQLLFYPMIDDRRTTPSASWDVPVWPPQSNTFGWTSYLPDVVGGPDVPGYAAAARATDLTGLPNTLLIVGGLDGFVDEDVAFASRLNQAGVSTELHVYPGGPHAFDVFAPYAALSKRATRDVAEWLSKQLSTLGTGS